jgi:hypothetical protein
MEQFDLNKVLKASIILISSNGEKTLSPKSVQTSIRILLMDNPELKNAISKGTQNVMKFSSEGQKPINFNKKNGKVREFLELEASQLVNFQVKLS